MNEFDEVEYIMDKVAMEDRDFAEFIDFVEDICNENEQLKSELKDYSDANAQLEERCSELLTATSELGGTTVARGLKIQRLEKENEQLKQQLFEARKDYIIETADISDKPYYDKEMEELWKEIFE